MLLAVAKLVLILQNIGRNFQVRIVLAHNLSILGHLKVQFNEVCSTIVGIGKTGDRFLREVTESTPVSDDKRPVVSVEVGR